MLTMKTWSIDSSLHITPVPALPEGTDLLECPEQLIDTLVLRNLTRLTTEFFGQNSKFLFHSTEYWGPFDIGCILGDGTLVCFENKAKSLNRTGFQKFLDDIQTVSSDALEYVTHRFEHLTKNHRDYNATAIRMFAAFFMRVRCDTVKKSRDLVGEAADLLGVSQHEFEVQFELCNDWLTSTKSTPTLSDYIPNHVAEIGARPILPVLLITTTCKNRVSAWIADTPDTPSNALLATYQFHSDNGQYPTYITTEPPTPMKITCG